jgi:phosphatidylinositol-3-phosphatase
MPFRKYALAALAVVVLSFVAAAAAQENAQVIDDASTLQQPVTPRSNHVVVVMEENRSVDKARQYMSFLKFLADHYSQGMQVYADSHGSWLAYGELTSGLAPFRGQGDHGLCNGDGCSQTITIDNVVRRLTAMGKTWRGYFQTMPYIGYMGYQSQNYVRRHNPFPFYSDVAYSPAQQAHMMPADPYMLQDIVSNRLANFTWISPDLSHDAHNPDSDLLALTFADYYLRSFVPQLLASPPFQPGGDGVLLITFDESEPGDDDSCGTNPDPENCGGHIWHVLVGPKVKLHYTSNTHYMQGSQWRMICDMLGISPCPGDGATSPTMSEFFVSLGPGQ